MFRWWPGNPLYQFYQIFIDHVQSIRQTDRYTDIQSDQKAVVKLPSPLAEIIIIPMLVWHGYVFTSHVGVNQLLRDLDLFCYHGLPSDHGSVGKSLLVLVSASIGTHTHRSESWHSIRNIQVIPHGRDLLMACRYNPINCIPMNCIPYHSFTPIHILNKNHPQNGKFCHGNAFVSRKVSRNYWVGHNQGGQMCCTGGEKWKLS